MIPSRISTVDRIPFKRNGKIDKLALSRIVPAQALSKMKSASSTEVSVLKVWQKVLRRNDIEPLDDFFEVGGNSLLALRLIDEIKVAINIKLSPSDLFEHSVLRELCKRIDVI
jgi:acyl carrier protein